MRGCGRDFLVAKSLGKEEQDDIYQMGGMLGQCHVDNKSERSNVFKKSDTKISCVFGF